MRTHQRNDRGAVILGAPGITAMILGVSVASAGIAVHPEECEPQKLIASDAGESGLFGFELDVSRGHTVIAGRRPHDPDGSEAVAYIFTREPDRTWSEAARLTHPDGSETNVFGLFSAIDGDIVAFGDPSADDACPGDPDCNSGAVFVFSRDPGTDAWSLTQRLLPDDGAAGDAFGRSVAIDGRVIVVGALRAGTGGAVYVFDRAGDDPWTQRARLAPPMPVTGAWFGQRSVVRGDVIAANAPAGEAVPPDNVRRVHLFERSSSSSHDWTHVAALESGRQADAFGLSIALGEEALIVGDPGDDREAINAGAVHVFRRTAPGTWLPIATLTEPAPAAQNGFGVAVTADGRVAGAASVPLTSVGAARTFRIERSGPPIALDVFGPPDDAVPSDQFGSALGLDAGSLIVGAPGDDDAANAAGAAYAFDLVACAACPGDVDIDGLVGFADVLSILARWGPCSGCPEDANGDGAVGFADVLIVLASWGPCA